MTAPAVLRRALPDGLAGRFALLLAVALIAANLVALALFSAERARLDRAAQIDREVERIVSLVPVIEGADPGRRKAIARQASTRQSLLDIDERPIVGRQHGGARAAALSRKLAEALPGRAVRAGVLGRHGRDRDGDRDGNRDGDGDDRRRDGDIAISIRLKVDAPHRAPWLNVVSRGHPSTPPVIQGRPFLAVLGLSLISVLGVGLVFVRRLTRPLRDLARAARAAGHGDRTVRVPEVGAREMREAAAAFNDMQTRIARFDAERMRTLAAVGHDLRTPITSLRIRAEMLDETEGAPMIRTLDEMTVMADGLVAFARGAGDAEAARPVDLGDLLARLCAARGAQLMPPDRTLTVAGRPVALGRAIGNLVDNALRYGGAARVGATERDGWAVVTIDDDGPGIPPERLATVFEPFVRGDASRNADTGGAGLGLSIARTIVSAHGGTVTLANRLQGGLTATVRLPLGRGQEL